MKYKVLIIEDDRFWDDMKRCKQTRFVLPRGEKRIEPIVVSINDNIETPIEQHKPDLISFNSIVVPDNLFEIVKGLKKGVAKNITVVAASFLPPMNIPKKHRDWFKIGLKDFYHTLAPYNLLIDFYTYVLTTKPKNYFPRFYAGELNWGAKVEWMGLRK